jgi:hypothetical protein
MTRPASIQVREEDNSMENRNAYLGIREPLESLSEEGAAQVFEQILSTRLPSLYRNAHRLLGNSADAEDAVQDALLAAYTHLDQFKGQADVELADRHFAQLRSNAAAHAPTLHSCASRRAHRRS